MMKNLYYTILIAAGILCIQSAAYAQVTVGTDVEPNTGAILDIKQYDAASPATDNSTATKGMVLPRVKLTDMSNLYPMFIDDQDYKENTENKKDKEDNIHTGLVVYNVNVDICEEIYSGTHVWDGEEWIPLGKSTFSGETDILIDNRNPSAPVNYKIGKFETAGWWMLENLRADRWPDGTNTDIVFDMPVAPEEPTYFSPRIYYPKKDPADFAANPHHGYIYNFFSATRLDYSQIANSSLGIQQGICPPGWHIPTVDEWVALINVIRNNPCQYAHSKINAEVGWNMQSMSETPNGASRSVEQGGFNGVLLGRINYSTSILELGERGYLWLIDDPYTSVYSSRTGVLLSDISGAGTYPNAFTYLIPVRCKKD